MHASPQMRTCRQGARRRSLALVAAVAMAGALLPGAMLSSAVHAAGPLCVNSSGANGCFNSIQSAINAATAGASISVAAGTYAESVLIQKPLTLLGAGAGRTIIDATDQKNGVVVDQVQPATPDGKTVVSGFTIENAKLEGVLVLNSAHVQIVHDTVQHNDLNLKVGASPRSSTCPGAYPLTQQDCGEGIHLQATAYTLVADNVIQHNAGGILLSDETGPTSSNLIVGNTVENNPRASGITLAAHFSPPTTKGATVAAGVYGNTVADNIATDNGGAGIGIYTPAPGTATYNNAVIGNTITSNAQGGIDVHGQAPNQNLSGNQIIANTLSGNGADPIARTLGPTGIVIFSNMGPAATAFQNMAINANVIQKEGIGVYIGTTAIPEVLRSNDFSGAKIGVDNAGTGAVDASLNYWGCAGGPGALGCAAVKGQVLSSPAL